MRIDPSPSDTERFWAKVDRGELDECWEWQAHSHKDGYGRFSIHGHTCNAHAVSYAIANGSFDNTRDQMVLHTCNNPSCVNPAHLYLGTQKDNMRDRSRATPATEGPITVYRPHRK